MVRKTCLTEQIINKLHEAEIILSSANYCVSVVNHMDEYRSLTTKRS